MAVSCPASGEAAAPSAGAVRSRYAARDTEVGPTGARPLTA
jgi:hypothetical protein